jgi:hypothetical protein
MAYLAPRNMNDTIALELNLEVIRCSDTNSLKSQPRYLKALSMRS